MSLTRRTPGLRDVEDIADESRHIKTQALVSRQIEHTQVC